jgi:hypothetical protein
LLRFWICFGSVKFSRTTRDLGQLLGDTERSSRRRSQAYPRREVNETLNVVKGITHDRATRKERNNKKLKPRVRVDQASRCAIVRGLRREDTSASGRTGTIALA